MNALAAYKRLTIETGSVLLALPTRGREARPVDVELLAHEHASPSPLWGGIKGGGLHTHRVLNS
jgi:hypothetical protein